MKGLFSSLETHFFIKILIIVGLFFIIFVGTNYFLLYQTAFSYTENKLKTYSSSLVKDFKILRGKLNAVAYYQDTTLPFDNTVYIITKDGFVIERSKYFPGLLDTVNSVYALSFQQPQTIEEEGGEKWRIISKKLIRKNDGVGTLLVAYNQPNPNIISDIDSGLREDMDKLESMIYFDKNGLNISKVNSREIKYTTYYQIIDSYNRLLIDEGAPPSYIDKSYIADFLGRTKTFTKKDSQTGEVYMFYLQPLLNDQGFVLVGKSIQDFQTVISEQRTFVILTSVILLCLVMALFFILKHELTHLVAQRVQEKIKILSTPTYINPQSISLNVSKGQLLFDNKLVQVEYGSKQCDFCKVLMSSPNKRWEQDEITDRLFLQDEDIHPRTYYDLRKTINKKSRPIIGKDFISYDKHRFFVNPEFSSAIVKPSKK